MDLSDQYHAPALLTLEYMPLITTGWVPEQALLWNTQRPFQRVPTLRDKTART
jgi:hypothetical protein